eukprot:TRINITY_DN44487_c0_g1_i2.p1 TRINITY_DN44487_c0_g1~~TRINITY_DN44487_c0_g1_i2.p1  ORF type:complete len:438 (+),score=67.35 TRINITY_DN44487_c0_g1_i2:45-1358(+)
MGTAVGDSDDRERGASLAVDNTASVASLTEGSRWCYEILQFTLFGLLNNGVICVCYGAAQDMCTRFGYPDLPSSVSFIACGAAVMGPLLLADTPLRLAGFRLRLALASGIGVVGLLLIAGVAWGMAPDNEGEQAPAAMALALIGVFLVGLQQSFGENTACVRFRRLPNVALSCWGAGTGLAGIFPNLLYDQIRHWDLQWRFLAAMPLLFVLLGNGCLVYRLGTKSETRMEQSLMGSRATLPDEDPPPSEERLASINRFEWYVIVVFCGVYGLEYFIYPTLVDRATKCPVTASLGEDAFNKSWICYNIGVTLSRSSVYFFRLPQLWILIVLQAANTILWSLEVWLHNIPRWGAAGYALQYGWMVFVGLMGGAAYANSMHVFNHSPNIASERRDKLINYSFALSMICMMSSTGLGMVLDNTVLQESVARRNCPATGLLI